MRCAAAGVIVARRKAVLCARRFFGFSFKVLRVYIVVWIKGAFMTG